jgi:hypothetical protein
LRARAQDPRIINEQIKAAELLCGLGKARPVGSISYVPGHRNNGGEGSQLNFCRLQGLRPTCVDQKLPAVAGKPTGERQAKSS